ncbi:hypothetical protein DO97_13775 [Neosynechococcus sphagnicola sy1]|uniref:Uncharacterized protein n=1 Tax=Neosynechococcus sphagnicola sy1 TaxID=1497020 RepID=A0A098TJ09_9CYAN|nr:hypothetical protein [Neosynechococcus sphagnicola]KGF71972.1 hypothetical protein DO97_13775 [Neosynechococcus sphagnicola sy1]
MLIILMDKQLLLPHPICQGCPLADQSGQPRWHHGQLGCGRALGRLSEQLPQQYECQMGFRIANIE